MQASNIERLSEYLVGRFTRTTPVPGTATGKYTRFREFVREDFEYVCAYCYLHEDHVGGERHFELDHFCPRRICPDKVDDFYNLYWSCHGCNKPGSKHAKLPDPLLISEGYVFVDLCQDKFEAHYELQPDGRLKPLTKKAEYTIEHIQLNNDDLVRLRRHLTEKQLQMDKGFIAK